MTTIDIRTPGAAYQLEIAPGAIARIGATARRVAPHGRCIVVGDRNVEVHARAAAASLASAGYDVASAEIDAEEDQKTLSAASRLVDAFLGAGLERGSPVVAVGGGLTGDVAGFAAAIYLRGVPVIQVPTTLLAMVDASVGGKTGVNHPVPGGALGKNLVGAFWQPVAVVADPLALRTLELRDLRCGLAESIKHGVLGDHDHFAWIEARHEDILALDADALVDLVAGSVAIKAAIVEEDVREAGRRALLNLGHTFAHAIEPIRELGLRHGEAVAIGLVAASQVARATGRLEAGDADRIRELIRRTGLPTGLAHPIEIGRLLAAMRFDKKLRDGRPRLVLPVAIGRAEIVDDLPEAVIAEGWAAVGAGTG